MSKELDIANVVKQLQKRAKAQVKVMKDLRPGVDLFDGLNREIVERMVAAGVCPVVTNEDDVVRIFDFKRLTSFRFVGDVGNMEADPKKYIIEPYQEMLTGFIEGLVKEASACPDEHEFCMAPVQIALRSENFIIEFFFYSLIGSRPITGETPE